MANGMKPPQPGQQPQQMEQDITPEQQQELTQYFEDMMINDWIKNEKGLNFSANDGDTSYDSLNRESKDRINHDVFNYYNNIYTTMIAEDEHAPNITFENFVLLHNPEKDFKVDLLDFNLGTKKTDATVWQNEFDTNTQLHKKAALDGYKYNLMMMGAAQGDVESQSE